jgi:hypothetical protein
MYVRCLCVEDTSYIDFTSIRLKLKGKVVPVLN